MQFSDIYPVNASKARERIKELSDKFYLATGKAPRLFSSPGRIEILGNHTDHNGGKVLVGAIDCDTLAAVMPSAAVNIVSDGYPSIGFEVSDLDKRADETGKSIGLVRGVMFALRDMGYNIGGFTAHITSNVFSGAGVSSSASFEMLIAEVQNALYNGGNIEPMTLAKAARFSENVYFCKPCGLLDQSGIALGGVTYIDFFGEPVIKHVAPALDGYEIILTNCGGDHSSLTDDYAAIKKEMNAVAMFFGKPNLSHVQEDAFYNALPALTSAVPGRAILRAAHFFSENRRVDAAHRALTCGNLDEFFKAVKESGESSYKLLQNCYVPNDPAMRIPLALMLSGRLLTDGAVRVHGGGFMGTTLTFIKKEYADNYREGMAKVFGDQNILTAHLRRAGTTEI